MPSPRAALLTVLALSLLALPAAASAKPDGLVLPSSFKTKVGLPRRNGYALRIETKGQRQVSIVIRRRSAAVTYTVKGRVSRNGIHANFGRFGRVDVRLRSGPWKKEKGESLFGGPCKGHQPMSRHGVAIGTIRVHGARGFVDLRVGHAPTQTNREFRVVCKFGGDRRMATRNLAAAADLQRIGGLTEKEGAGAPESGKEEFDVALLEASARGHGRIVKLLAANLFGVPFLVLAEVRERVSRVLVTEAAVRFGPKGVKFSKPGVEPETVRVHLAPPFAGKAVYAREGRQAPQWTGSLRMRLPGSGIVPLTGSGFHAHLCRVEEKHPLKACRDF